MSRTLQQQKQQQQQQQQQQQTCSYLVPVGHTVHLCEPPLLYVPFEHATGGTDAFEHSNPASHT